jgi:hypothetical protein
VVLRKRIFVRAEQANTDHGAGRAYRSSPNNIFHFIIYAFGVGTLTGPTVIIFTALVGAAEGQRTTLSLALQITLFLALSVFAGLYAETAITNLRHCWVVLRAPRN